MSSLTRHKTAVSSFFCDNFLYVFKGTPSARQASPKSRAATRKSAEGDGELKRRNRQGVAAEHGDAPTPGRQHAAP